MDWPKIDKTLENTDPFGYLAFLLQFAPTTGSAAVEVPLRKKFARIGIEAGKPFPTIALSDAGKAAMTEIVTPTEAAIKASSRPWGSKSRAGHWLPRESATELSTTATGRSALQ